MATLIASVAVLARDTLLLTFTAGISVDDNLRATSSYTVTPDGTGDAVQVRDVIVEDSVSSVTQIVLVVSKPTIGAQYTVAVAGLTDAENMAVADSDQFEDRLTKLDNVLNNMPKLYTREHRSVFRNILQAVTREDDLIGGSREDFLT